MRESDVYGWDRGPGGAVVERGGPEISGSSVWKPRSQGEGAGGMNGESERGRRDVDAEVRGDQLAGEITLEEVRNVVRQAIRGKAVGDDGIPNEFLKEGGEIVMARTEQVFNVVREEEYVPKVWRVGDSVLLEKGGTGRICIIIEGLRFRVVWGSCMEIFWGTGWGVDAEARGVHSDLQIAFKEGRSALEAVFILGEIIEVGVREGRGKG